MSLAAQESIEWAPQSQGGNSNAANHSFQPPPGPGDAFQDPWESGGSPSAAVQPDSNTALAIYFHGATANPDDFEFGYQPETDYEDGRPAEHENESQLLGGSKQMHGDSDDDPFDWLGR